MCVRASDNSRLGRMGCNSSKAVGTTENDGPREERNDDDSPRNENADEHPAGNKGHGKNDDEEE